MIKFSSMHRYHFTFAIIHYSLFITHYLLFTSPNSLFTIHYSLFTFIIHFYYSFRSPDSRTFTIHHSLLTSHISHLTSVISHPPSYPRCIRKTKAPIVFQSMVWLFIIGWKWSF